MALSHFIALAEHPEDRVYIPLEDTFDIRTLCLEEGIAISTYDNGRIDFLGKYIEDSSISSGGE